MPASPSAAHAPAARIPEGLSGSEDTGVARPLICVLFRWMPGRQVRRGLTPRHLEGVGELMARLQNHALQWGPATGFAEARGRVDWPMEAVRYAPDGSG